MAMLKLFILTLKIVCSGHETKLLADFFKAIVCLT